MSRRESRSSLGARQNDALFEFENFKKKFLLANKHITKLNSTLSVRIEELNAQISLLYVENLRLRASEIALAAQLKREREKSHRVLTDAEAATQNLTKHLSYLREFHNIKHAVTTPPSPPSPRARRPPLNVNPTPASPQLGRIARPPNVPGILEDDEPSSEEQEKHDTPPRKRSKTKPRLSASKLPLPTRAPSPTRSATPLSVHHNNDTASTSQLSKHRKTVRRPSGLLELNMEALSVPRSGSPAFGSPIRLEAGRAEEAEEFAFTHGGLEVDIVDQENESERMLKKEKRKGKAKEQRESESERDASSDPKPRVKEKKKQRDELDDLEGIKLKPTKDVAAPRSALQPIDSNVHEPLDEVKSPSNRQFLRAVSPAGSAPTSRSSSSPAPPGSSETEGAPNRERRTRKSVNYAEPKLNTKMRKPDPPPGSAAEPVRKKRSSAAAVMTGYKPPSSLFSMDNAGVDADVDTEARSSLEIPPPVPPLLPPTTTTTTHAPASLPLRGMNGGYINPELFPLPPSRPGSAAAMYSPGPPTRTTGSTTSDGSSSTSNSATNTAAVKRKKSRPRMVLSDEEDGDSDGAEADAEYVGSSGGGGGGKGAGSWVNVEGRRKALPKRSAAAAAVAALEDIRRHSMAI